jgi:hypothetical protein
MLTDADRELISAALDGDLSPAEEATFRRLLAESAEACALFRHLQADARRLRCLPAASAPARLADRVLARLDLPIPTTTRPAPAARVGWPGYAVAASALLAVTAGSFWLARPGADDTDAVAQRESLPRGADPNRQDDVGSPAVPREAAPETISAPREAVPSPRDFATRTPEPAPLPRPAGTDTVVGSGLLTGPKPVETVQVRLPYLAPVADLDRADAQAKVVDELGRDPAYRLDLFTRDVLAGAEVFQAAARSAGLKVTVETVAQERLKKKVPPTAWAVYTDALTAAEIARLMAEVAVQNRADRTAPFTTAHLYPAQAAEQRDLHHLLGTDVGPWKRATADPKPVSAGTAGQLAAALQKSGKGAEKSALFLTYLPVRERASPKSPQIAAFVDRLGVRRPDTLPLLVVIRQAN